MSSISVGDANFFSPRSCHIDQFTFHISLPNLKFTIFIHLNYNQFLEKELLYFISAIVRGIKLKAITLEVNDLRKYQPLDVQNAWSPMVT